MDRWKPRTRPCQARPSPGPGQASLSGRLGWFVSTFESACLLGVASTDSRHEQAANHALFPSKHQRLLNATCLENVNFIPASHHHQLHRRGTAFNVSGRASVDVSLQETVKMETITIPSPSAFLSSPVLKPAPEPPPPPKRKPAATFKPPSATKKQSGISKPKQSKSRNGTLGNQGLVLSWP
jgi:hypothetical protein